MVRLWTVAELANYVGVRPQTVYGWVRHGHLRGIKIGPNTLRIPQSEVDRVTDVAIQAFATLARPMQASN